MPPLMKTPFAVSPAMFLSGCCLALAALFVTAAHGDDPDPIFAIESPAPAPGGSPVVHLFKSSELLGRTDLTHIRVTIYLTNHVRS